MYHDYDGNQVAGWNRLTQELVDDGTYVTGTAKPLDTDGDGQISHEEYAEVADLVAPFIFTPAVPLDTVTADFFDPLMALEIPAPRP